MGFIAIVVTDVMFNQSQRQQVQKKKAPEGFQITLCYPEYGKSAPTYVRAHWLEGRIHCRG